MKEMTPKQRVMAAFVHKIPDRVPCWCGMSDEFAQKAKSQLKLDDEGLLEYFGDDFRRVHTKYVGPDIKLSPQAKSRDVFGVERSGIGYGHAINHPLAGLSLKEVEAYPWPDPDWFDVSHIKSDAQQYEDKYAILGGQWSPLWHDVIDLMGMENMYIKMFEDPDLVSSVFSHVTDFYYEVTRRIFDSASDAIDIFFIGNDLGSTNGPLIGPDLFKRYVLAHIERLVGLGHEHNLFVQMHCCGGYEPLINMLIEVGMDGLHAVQPSCHGMDLKNLKQKYGQKILFNGAIDSHHTLIDGDVEKVIKDTTEVLDIMMPGGGYVAGASHDSILEETPVENIIAMFETVREYGKY